jgi:hypothetical protein
MLAAEMPDADLPQWLETVDLHTVAVLTLDDGERVTAEILEFNDERGELIVDVVSSNRSYTNSGKHGHAIPVSHVVSCEPQARTVQPWPYSDPCCGRSFSLARFALMASLFLCTILGAVPLFLMLMKRPYGLQEASAIVYTTSVVFGTFAAIGKGHAIKGKDLPPYMFTCPAVRLQIPRLLWRHLGFVVTLFALQTGAIAARSNLPEWWNTQDRKGSTPFELCLMLSCFGLFCAQVFTNRSLLGRAHREFSA